MDSDPCPQGASLLEVAGSEAVDEHPLPHGSLSVPVAGGVGGAFSPGWIFSSSFPTKGVCLCDPTRSSSCPVSSEPRVEFEVGKRCPQLEGPSLIQEPVGEHPGFPSPAVSLTPFRVGSSPFFLFSPFSGIRKTWSCVGPVFLPWFPVPWSSVCRRGPPALIC